MSLDEDRWEEVADAVRQFKGFHRPGSREETLRVLATHAPGVAQEELAEVFDLLCAVYDRAVDAVPRHVRRRIKLHPFATKRDIDARACLAELDELAPGVATRQKRYLLNWVIYWHYVR